MGRSNIFGNYVLGIMGIILPILSLPIISRYMGAENFALYIYLQVIFMYISALADYGMSTFGISYIATRASEIDKILSASLLIRGAMALISVLLSYVAIYFMLDAEYARGVMLSSLFICSIGAALSPVWIANALEQTNSIAFTFSISRILFMLILILSSMYLDKFEQIFLIFSIGVLIPNLICLYILLKNNDIKFKIDISEVVGIGQAGFSSLLANTASTAFGGSMVFVAKFNGASLEYMAVLGATERVVRGVISIFSPFMLSIQPKVALLLRDGISIGTKSLIRYFIFVMSAYSFTAFMVYFFSEPISNLFGKEFIGIKYLLPPLLLWGGLGLVNNFLGIQYLTGLGLNKLYSNIFMSNTVVLISLYATLGRENDYFGIVYSVLMAEACLAIILSIYAWKIAKRSE